MSTLLLRLKNLVKPLKLHDYNVKRGQINPKKYLSETGAAVFDLMEDAEFWTLGRHCLEHASGLELWVCSGQSNLDIWRMPNGDRPKDTGVLSKMDRYILWKQVQRLKKFLEYEDQRETSEYLRKMKT